MHKSFPDGTEIMVFQLLAFCRRVTEYCSSAHDQVGTGIGQGFVDYKIFLFPAQCADYLGNILIEIITNIHCGLIHSFQRLQQGRFIIQCFAGIGNKYGRDT